MRFSWQIFSKEEKRMNDTITIGTEFLSERCTVVTLTGRFDAASANALKETFRRVIGGAVNCVIVDMEGVTFIDSAGLSAFITALRLVRGVGGRLVICAMQSQAHAVFVLTKLDQIVSIYPTRQAAVAAVGSRK
jgi:anti-sigma B factor antagonist